MPSRIELHALAHVAGEPVGLPGQGDRAAAGPPAGHPGTGPGVRELERLPGGKAGRHAPPGGGDTPVTPDAGHRAGGEPETPADHRGASRPPARRVPLPGRAACAATSGAGSRHGAPRRRARPARPTGPPAIVRPSPASAVTWPASSLIPAPSSSMLAVTDSVWSSWRPARSTACCAPSTASLRPGEQHVPALAHVGDQLAALGQQPSQPEQHEHADADQQRPEHGGDQRGEFGRVHAHAGSVRVMAAPSRSWPALSA